MTKTVAGLVLGLLIAVAAPSYAATYQYVNTAGSLVSVTANSEAEAAALATDRDPASGFIVSNDAAPATQPAVTEPVIATPAETGDIKDMSTATLKQFLSDLRRQERAVSNELRAREEDTDEEEEVATGAGRGSNSCEEEVTMEIDPSRTRFSGTDDGMYFTVMLESKCDPVSDQKFVMDTPNQYDMRGVPNDSVDRNNKYKAKMKLSFYKGPLSPGVYPITFTTADETKTIEITIE